MNIVTVKNTNINTQKNKYKHIYKAYKMKIILLQI